MIKIPRHPNLDTESEQSESEDYSVESEDRVRAIRIDENRNEIH